MKWLLNPNGRDNVGRQKGAKLLLADPERREEKAPDYVKWPEFHDMPTMCGIRMLEKIIYVALKLEKPLIHKNHFFGGNPMESNRFQGELANSLQQKDISQHWEVSPLLSGQAEIPKVIC